MKYFKFRRNSTIIHVITTMSQTLTSLPCLSMDAPRRSQRNTKNVNYADTLTPSYPEQPPRNAFERCIAFLNNQSFISSSFSIVDDALVYSLFSSKRRINGYRAIITACAFGEEDPPITKEEGILICNIYKEHIREQGKGNEESIRKACNAMSIALPDIFTRDTFSILQQ